MFSADSTMHSADGDSTYEAARPFDIAESDVEIDVQRALENMDFDELRDVEHFIESLRKAGN